jgi:pimeloyl-ACP methyl ester carboxylesterase
MTIDNQNASRFGADFTDVWITVDETKLHFVKTGEGPPIILIPGWPQTWYAWRRVMPLLAKSGRRVIVCDPPGLGDSDLLPAGKKYDTGAVADLLAKAFQALGVDRADVVGHDIGTWIAFAHAAQHPEMVRRLVLLEAGLPGITPDSAFALANAPRVFQFYFNSVPELPELLTRGKEREFLGWLFRTKTVNHDAISPADLDEYLRTYSDPARMTAGFEYYRAVLTDIEQNKSGYLNMPVLALGAEKGVGTTLYTALRKHVADLEGGLIPGHGHYLPEECPEELTRRLLAFLGGEG